jgi:hypothetical protein
MQNAILERRNLEFVATVANRPLNEPFKSISIRGKLPKNRLYCRVNLFASDARDMDQRHIKVVSVNTGLPREVKWHGRSVITGIFKEPVHGRVVLRKLNLDGDRQADLSVHGGEFKAVYCYPLEHYDYWKRELPDRELRMGIFGENLTLEGLLEESVHLGRSVFRRFSGSGPDPASPPLLQTWHKI